MRGRGPGGGPGDLRNLLLRSSPQVGQRDAQGRAQPSLPTLSPGTSVGPPHAPPAIPKHPLG